MSRLKATILCIDDHWNGLLGPQMVLGNTSDDALEATGGDEGLKLFLSHSVDAVVLDYQMPGMNGDVVAAKMKRVKSHVPIMLLSAYGPTKPLGHPAHPAKSTLNDAALGAI